MERTVPPAPSERPEMTLQLTIDCAEPQRLVPFWLEALRYIPDPPPAGHATWRAYWEAIGVPEDELADGAGELPESIVDPEGVGPRVWFQQVPEPKTVKNRVHLDLKVGGGRDVPLALRRERVDGEVARLTALGATILYAMDEPNGMDYYAVVLQDPEGNEFCLV
ncbi:MULTISPECIES: VOC family protein [unclassified Streptomyces]|uniref:VOC family protein n=1 Tax=unclassified Streptomyces TaxID=2593676 RepID=UPI0006F219F9|nr:MULTISPECIES: VOC family protein [unclassified Streptomyces]KQX57367.1 glyoxalase [Streptomyces sp. Root1304]KRA98739.1 glyoxalase [Streptomyces sp. Root66D1]